MNNKAYCFHLIIFSFVWLITFSPSSFSQVELVPPSNKVYDFLDRMQINKVIDNYSSSMLPLSRREIGRYLQQINTKRSKLSATDKKFLDDYFVEYEYDMSRTLKKSSYFFSKKGVTDIFSNRRQKYLYSTADSNSSLFLDAIGELRYIGADGDSLGKPHLLLGQIGLRFRGTLFNSVGYYLKLSNGVRLGGTDKDAFFAAQFDPILGSTRKFISEGAKTYDSFEGYVRYAPAADWLGLTAGREALRFGTGFIDKIILSNTNSAPFDFIKLDLAYKKIRYSFLHASIVGTDSSGLQLESKYLAFHRVEFGPFINNFMKIGFSEMLIYSNLPINFAFLNPLAFLTSADLNTEIPGKNSNNAILGIDAQFYPIKKITVQGTLLIDDINFETLGKSDKIGNDNKFAFQCGFNWQDALFLKNLGFTYEYTRIDPFVYSHRGINNSYANWGYPIGHALNPNSDEHALRLSYDFGSRLNITLIYKLQRSGMNVYDSTGKVVTNVGSDILQGWGDFLIKNEFLNGLRVNRNIFIAEISWQPIRQYYFSVKFQNRSFDYVDSNRKLTDNIFWGIFKIDY